MSERRRYTLKRRAEGQADTRRRIVEAAMALHEELGPRATTISAIARRAGVQRLTVYRHFPDETAVFQACTSHWLALNPPPGPEEWVRGSPDARRAAALGAFYAYYRRTSPMLSVSHRDEAAVPALQAPMQALRAAVAEVALSLAQDLGPRGRATMRHALGYLTWDTLDQLGVDDEAKVDLALAWLAGATRADARGRGPPRGA